MELVTIQSPRACAYRADTQRADADFAALLAPLTVAEFFADYFERQAFRIRRGAPDYYHDILTLADVDRALGEVDMFYPAKRAINNAVATPPPPETYTAHGRRIDPARFVAQYAAGATLALARLHQEVPALRRLVDSALAATGHPHQTNIYLTPADAQGFAPHYDTHDVFILQFSGRKTWRIYERGLALASKQVPFEKGGFEFGAVTAEFVLEPGDLLYLPRGVGHDAFCTGEASGHITLGMIGDSWAEHLAARLLEAAKTSVPLRRHPRFDDPDSGEPHRREVAQVVAELIRDLTTDPEVCRGMAMHRRGNDRTLLRSVEASRARNPASRVRLRAGVSVSHGVDAAGALLLQRGDVELGLPPACEVALGRLGASTGPIPASELADPLDLDSVYVLVDRLVGEGFAEVVGA